MVRYKIKTELVFYKWFYICSVMCIANRKRIKWCFQFKSLFFHWRNRRNRAKHWKYYKHVTMRMHIVWVIIFSLSHSLIHSFIVDLFFPFPALSRPALCHTFIIYKSVLCVKTLPPCYVHIFKQMEQFLPLGHVFVFRFACCGHNCAYTFYFVIHWWGELICKDVDNP